MRYVIIGNSAAGVFGAEAIRKQDPIGRIDIISDENYLAYARCLTSYYLTGKVADEQMFIRGEDFYQSNNINLHKEQKVIKIETRNRKVYTLSGEVYDYDKLLIATGSSPVIPDLPGVQNKGVFALRTLSDAKGILKYGYTGKNAIVVGGGFVALKAAYALLKAGLSVTCLISSGQVLSQMLDEEAARIIATLLINNGLKIKYYTDVKEILGQNGVINGVRLANGGELTADLVIFGKGVVPNIDLIAGSGIETDCGILVNKYMQTNLPEVYAAGDVAQGHDIITGKANINALWPNATEQGTVAGYNMAGAINSYCGSIGMNSADFFGLSTIAAGKTKGKEEEGYEIVKLFLGENQYRRFVFKNNNLVGFIMVGETSKAGLLTTLIKEQIPLGDVKKQIVQGHIRQRLLW